MNNLGNEKEKCSICGSSNFPFFIKVGIKAICIDCKPSKQYKKEIKQEQARLFTKYICTIHKCETYHVQQMFGRHYMGSVCNIIEKVTVGIERPATKGGLNGDISRKHFYKQPDLEQLVMRNSNYVKFKKIEKTLIIKRMASRRATLGELINDVSSAEKTFYYNHLYFKDSLNLKINIDNSKLTVIASKLLKVLDKDLHRINKRREFKKDTKKKYYNLRSVLDHLDNEKT